MKVLMNYFKSLFDKSMESSLYIKRINVFDYAVLPVAMMQDKCVQRIEHGAIQSK